MTTSYKLKIKDKNKKFIVIDFIDEYIDKITISGILHSPNINNLFPIKDRYFRKAFISYKYTSKIGSKFTNYQTVVNNVNTNYQCYCNLYTDFIDTYHKHGITDNLGIVANQEIKTLLSKGLNFRVQC